MMIMCTLTLLLLPETDPAGEFGMYLAHYCSKVSSDDNAMKCLKF